MTDKCACYYPRSPWRDCGVRECLGLSKLMYHSGTQKLIAHFRSTRPGAEPRSVLYVRHVTDDIYRPLSVPSRRTTQEYPVCSVAKPSLYCVVTRWSKYRQTWGGDGHSLRHIDLMSEKETVLARDSDIALPPECSRAWFANLLSVDDAPNQLVCTVAYDYTQARPGSCVEYWLCHFSIRTQTLSSITRLKGVFL